MLSFLFAKSAVRGFLIILFVAFSVSAQETAAPEDYKLRRGAREYNFEIGYSPFEPTHFTGEKEYNTAGRKLGTANIRFGRVVGTSKGVTFQYLFGVTPLVVSLKNEVLNKRFVSPTATPNEPRTRRETSYGAGVAPVNFRFSFLPKSRIKPYAQAGAGILIFNKSMPLPESRKLQFTGEFGGGIQIHKSKNKVFTLGYRYFHISNGNFTEKKFNVGYNANVFYIGYSLFK